MDTIHKNAKKKRTEINIEFIFKIYYINFCVFFFLGKNLIVFARCIHDSGNNQKRQPWNYDKLSNWGYDNKRGTYIQT